MDGTSPTTAVFRADSGVRIGSGHIMRCLTLADVLAKNGIACHFVTRAHEGHLAGLIADRGHGVTLLPRPETDADYGNHPEPPAHAAWLGETWQNDAMQTRTIVEELRPQWLIVDHYAVESAWETDALTAGTRLAVIDDLADREHIADLLLDQNAGRSAEAYNELAPAECLKFIGPGHALLRPQFTESRSAALDRRGTTAPRRLLVALGGVDQNNITGELLKLLAKHNVPAGFSATVVLGTASPWIEANSRLVDHMPWPATLRVGVENMAGEMMNADVCVAGGGTTVLECATLGLPTVVLAIAENQRPGARALLEAKYCLGSNACDATSVSGMSRTVLPAIDALLKPDLNIEYSSRIRQLTDGSGAKRLACHILGERIRLAAASTADAEFVWQCRHEGEAWKYYRQPRPIPIEDHFGWFANALERDDVQFYVAQLDGEAIGTMRFDFLEKATSAEMSLALAGKARGRGLGCRLIARGIREAKGIGIRKLVAEVHANNASSLSSFERAGFTLKSQSGLFYTLGLTLTF